VGKQSMYSKFRNAICAGALAAVGPLAIAPAHATPTCSSPTLSDNYIGGDDTWNYPSDVIGDPNTFQISGADVSRINGGNTLQVTICTDYAGAPGTSPADGTGYGDLFITPGAHAWHPTGTVPYPNDTYQPGEWEYVATIPQDPGSATTGNGALYLTSGGSVVTSNVDGHSQTYPIDPTSGYYFRADQAVDFTPGSGAVGGTSETWTVGTDTITFDIVDNGMLGDDFALAWAMTCANDVIQGQVSIPEPPTYALLLAGFLFAGAYRTWWRRKQVCKAILSIQNTRQIAISRRFP
jgi:hypothetical protein